MTKKAEFLGALFLFLLGICFSIKAWQIPAPPLMQSTNTLPSFFPLLTGILFTLLCLVHLLSIAVTPAGRFAGASGDFFDRLGRMTPAFLILAIVLAYIAFIEALGWLLCTFFMVFAVLAVAERATTDHRKWLANLFLAILLTAMIYVIFDTLLGVMLPKPEIWGLESLFSSF